MEDKSIIVVPSHYQPTLDNIIGAWLHAKSQRTNSEMAAGKENEMSERLTHNQFTFTRWSEYWCSEQAAHQSDLCREMVSLEANGIPSESMKIVCFDFDRSGGFRWYRLTIDFSASSQVVALADRLHQAWLTQKAIEEAQWDKQYEAAMKNQEAQGMNNPDFEWGF